MQLPIHVSEAALPWRSVAVRELPSTFPQCAIVPCRLEDLKALNGLASAALSMLHDLQQTGSAQEAFDIMGLLPAVLSSHSSCEQFLGWD